LWPRGIRSNDHLIIGRGGPDRYEGGSEFGSFSGVGRERSEPHGPPIGKTTPGDVLLAKWLRCGGVPFLTVPLVANRLWIVRDDRLSPQREAPGESNKNSRM